MFKVGIIGCTGAVGKEAIETLHKRNFPLSELRLFSSERSAGTIQKTPYGDKTCELFTVEKAREVDIIIMAGIEIIIINSLVSGDFSLENAKKICATGGPIVIDNSSAWRYDPEIPLICPEINHQKMTKGIFIYCNIYCNIETRLIANPNCTTLIAAVVLYPLHQHFHLKKVFVSSYQATSGAGWEGMEELKKTTLESIYKLYYNINIINSINK